MGESLSLGEARDAAFVLTGVGTWVSKPAYLATDPLTIQEGQQAIAQAITECQIKVRGPGYPCVNLLSLQPFRFDCLGDSPQEDPLEMPIWIINQHPTSLQEARTAINIEEIRGYHHLSYLCHHGFGSYRSLVLTASSMSSLSDKLEGSQHSQYGR